jgi:hypothetical protein
VSAIALLRPTSCRVFIDRVSSSAFFSPTSATLLRPRPSGRGGGALPPTAKLTVLEAINPKLNYATIITGYSNHRPTGGTRLHALYAPPPAFSPTVDGLLSLSSLKFKSPAGIRVSDIDFGQKPIALCSCASGRSLYFPNSYRIAQPSLLVSYYCWNNTSRESELCS